MKRGYIKYLGKKYPIRTDFYYNLTKDGVEEVDFSADRVWKDSIDICANGFVMDELVLPNNITSLAIYTHIVDKTFQHNGTKPLTAPLNIPAGLSYAAIPSSVLVNDLKEVSEDRVISIAFMS